MLFTYVGMLSYNIDMLTVPLDDMRTITDTQGRIVEYKNFSELDWYITNETSGVADLPINEVSRVLYLQEWSSESSLEQENSVGKNDVGDVLKC